MSTNFTRRLLPLVAVLIAAMAVPAVANAVTIGQTSPTAAIESFEGYAVQAATGAAVVPTPSYVVPPGTWTLTSWSTHSHQGITQGTVKLVVFRQIGGATPTYTVVGESAPVAPTGEGLRTFGTSFEVQGGDVLGLDVLVGLAPYRFATGNPADRILYSSQHAGPGTLSPPGLASGWRLNVSAELAPIDETAEQGVSVPPRAGYCSVAGNTTPDGDPLPAGTFLNLLLGQPLSDAGYAGAVPAFFVRGIGITCDLPPVGFSFSDGVFVDGLGAANGATGAIYPLFEQG
jgi:hypothetical protein